MGRRSLRLRKTLENEVYHRPNGAEMEESSGSRSSLEGEDGWAGEDRDGDLSNEASPEEARDEC